MLTRDQGQKRISAVTVGLVAASVAGTLAVGAAAYAKESDTTAPTPSGTPGPGLTTPAPGATTPPAAPPAAPQAPAKTPELKAPPGDVTTGDGPAHAKSGGS